MAGAPSGPAPPAPPPPPSAAPGGPAMVACPACHAPNPASSKFCNSCGAALAPPPPASAPPVDIRERVDQDRGTLKRLQMLIPGFRGYRQGEDIREADSYLRMQVATKVHAA